jgi:hypothetical protein
MLIFIVLVAFQDAPETTWTAVCQPYIDAMRAMDLLPEVIAEYESQNLPHDWAQESWAGIFQFSQAHLEKRQEVPMASIRWDFDQATAIISTYDVIRDFAKDFASKALQRRPLTAHGYQPELNEMGRIMRTFYKFQIFCNMFREPHIVDVWGWPDGGLSLQKHLVLDKFVPHENEQ